ncbi:MAG: nucleotidyltransferase family protein [Colwellia sp.]|nr:nucleotidyltransferase family protein [Colwellia sp.]
MLHSILLSVLIKPNSVSTFTHAQWNLLLRQASTAKMLTRIEHLLTEHKLLDKVPAKVQSHFYRENVKISHLHTQVKQEIQILNQLFKKNNINPIYLKGTAYFLTDLPLAKSRTFGDIDILLNQEDIAKIEIVLKCQGWISQKSDDHDQEYYRNFMHEIPPMQNMARGTIIDIHHNILPICNKNTINIELLKLNAFTAVQDSNVKGNVLAPEAMFLHSAIHLFHEGEFEQGLRGLSDLDILFQHFDQKEENFSQKLIQLAEKINQGQSLYFAWHYLNKIFERKLPKLATHFVKDFKKKVKLASLHDFIFFNMLISHHSSTKTWSFVLASHLAYWRGHLLRMPLYLLIPHLLKKATITIGESFSKKPKVSKLAADLVIPPQE